MGFIRCRSILVICFTVIMFFGFVFFKYNTFGLGGQSLCSPPHPPPPSHEHKLHTERPGSELVNHVVHLCRCFCSCDYRHTQQKWLSSRIFDVHGHGLFVRFMWDRKDEKKKCIVLNRKNKHLMTADEARTDPHERLIIIDDNMPEQLMDSNPGLLFHHHALFASLSCKQSLVSRSAKVSC